MSRKYQRVKIATKFCQRFCRNFFAALNKQIIWLFRTIFGSSRRRESGNAGFVLPTVVLVSLVVVLVTTAILFRAFDRSKNASYVRVNEILVNASMPAIDRAKAKLNQLLNDPGLPRSTPTDESLYGLIKNIPASTTANVVYTDYNFGDETPLELAYDINGDGKIQNGYNSAGTVYTIENDETLNSAWKFPVDTDNNGKFDTFTLYAIYFRNPPRASNGDFNRVRNGLEARTPPMNENQAGGNCAAALGTSANLVGDSSWYKAGGNLAKSFYVYTVNVPITTISGLNSNNYEAKVNRGVSALEYQQDRFRVPINNNAVWFENDLEIEPGTSLYINGSIHTNGNLLAGAKSSTNSVYFRQVSSAYSCYYSQDNAKVTVGGNYGTGDVADSSSDYNGVSIDLYQGYGVTPTTSTIGGSGTTSGTTNQRSTSYKGGYQVGFNDAAYNSRINLMTQTAINLCSSGTPPTTCTSATTVSGLKTAFNGTGIYPTSLIQSFNSAIQAANLADGDYSDAFNILTQQIRLYFSNRTRRVPFAEVSYANTASGSLIKYAGATGTSNSYSSSTVFAASTPIDVPEEWRDILPAPTSTNTATTYTGLPLYTSTSTPTTFVFPATDPRQLAIDGIENTTGDRVLLGNNIAAYWRDYTQPQSNYPYVTGTATQQLGSSIVWDRTYPPGLASTNPNALRTRTTQLQAQTDLGVTDRGEFWEQSAATDPASTSQANVGGMRIVTGAGIYVDDSTSGGDVNAYFPRTSNTGNKNSTTSYSFLPVPTLDTNFVCPYNGSNTTPSSVAPCPVQTTGIGTSATTSNTGLMPYPSPQLNTGSAGSPSYQTDILVWPDTMPMTSPSSTEYRQGDLLMRATAVYHYVNNSGMAQTPIACISSYYDPTNSTTAGNLSDLTKSWQTLSANINSGRSNNGIVYTFPGRTIDSTTLLALERQASLIFPNGTIANLPLRTAIQKYVSAGSKFTNFSYADYSAVDTALCSLGILKSMGILYMPSQNVSATRSTTYIADGKIKESSFLDAREVKALQSLADYQNSSKLGDYGLTLEQRSPLEIRSTDIDVSYLATISIGNSTSGESDYLLPNSGIIYATRDDAIADCSYLTVDTNASDFNTSTSSNTPCNSNTISTDSQTDFKLDPTRRPNAIRLINSNTPLQGTVLARGGANSSASNYNSAEKGLILVTNLPAYIRGTFNLHTVDGTTQIYEFTDTPSTKPFISSSNWYKQQKPNQSFACRPGRPGCTASTNGDLWRPAAILADAITILSDSFTDGFRNQGNFDLNRNDSSIPLANSVSNLTTYVTSPNNGLVNSLATNNTSWVNLSTNNPNTPSTSPTFIPTSTSKASSYFANGVTPIQRRGQFNEYLMESCNDIAYNCSSTNPLLWTTDGVNQSNWNTNGTNSASGLIGTVVTTSAPASGTTGQLAPSNPYYPRRVAFERYLPSTSTVSPVTVNGVTSPVVASGTHHAGDLVLRNSSGTISTTGSPVPLGIDNTNKVVPAYYGSNYTPSTPCPSTSTVCPNAPTWTALWFAATTTSGSTANPTTSVSYSSGVLTSGVTTNLLLLNVPTSSTNTTPIWQTNFQVQPQLAPITQIFNPDGAPSNTSALSSAESTDSYADQPGVQRNWVQQASLTGTSSSASANTFNVALAVGNSPSRTPEYSAGLPTFVRFLENWNSNPDGSSNTVNNTYLATSHTISGSFIQFKRSSYATASAAPLIISSSGTATTTCPGGNIFGGGICAYYTNILQPSGVIGASPYYVPPTRNWGFDVGLLSQVPDLFAQRFTVPPSGLPAEYFREVNEDDTWVQTLLCAKQVGSGATTYNTSAVPANYLPSSCPTATYP